jgi:hypothetical protein
MSTPPSGDQGWGKGLWGTSQWGSGITLPPAPPKIIAVAPLPNETGVPQSLPLCISITDETQVAFASIRITIGGVIYFFSGSAQNDATVDVQINSNNGFDIEVRTPEKYPLGSRQEVTIYVQDNDGDVAEKNYFFSVGVGPRLISVQNPSPGVLLAHFNEPMLHDKAFLNPDNWKVTTITPGAEDVVITEAFANSTHANTAVLHHTGGGSTYELTALALTALSGDPLELAHNTALFELVFGADPPATIRLFDTIFGPIGVSQRILRRRTIDDLVVNRSIAIGMDEQFRLRMQNLDGSAGGDGRPGIRRT